MTSVHTDLTSIFDKDTIHRSESHQNKWQFLTNLIY